MTEMFHALSLSLSLSLLFIVGGRWECNGVIYAEGQFLLIVRYHDEGLVSLPAESVYHLADMPAVAFVEAMQRFVEN